MLKNLDNPQVVKHLAFSKAHEVLKFNMAEFGLDIDHIRSADYNYKHRDQAKREEFDKLKSCFDYNMQQFFEGMPKLYEAVKSHRKDVKKGSVLCDTFMHQYDIWKTSIDATKNEVRGWWRDNHPRTSCKVKCDKDTLGNVRIEQNLDSYWKEGKIFVSPLWFHKVYKKGLSTVQYMGRPCFVGDVKKVEIDRLSADGINAYKVNIVSAKSGELKVHNDMWLASYQVNEGSVGVGGGKIVAPETINAVSPELRRAETNVSQRITREVLGNLLD
jgi:hypothetical protein|tara:strand:+ start:368 stop:1186 length:819 start_codon:yes stop_codon:yes gene_type:complete